MNSECPDTNMWPTPKYWGSCGCSKSDFVCQIYWKHVEGICELWTFVWTTCFLCIAYLSSKNLTQVKWEHIWGPFQKCLIEYIFEYFGHSNFSQTLWAQRQTYWPNFGCRDFNLWEAQWTFCTNFQTCVWRNTWSQWHFMSQLARC